jgi:hypothetical protein
MKFELRHQPLERKDHSKYVPLKNAIQQIDGL